MNRCKFLITAGALALAFALPASAQFMQPDGKRKFPVDVERGTLLIKQPPYVLMDNQEEILAPGVRITGLQNTLLMSGALVGTPMPVNYRRNSLGQISEVWLITEAEAKVAVQRDPAQMKPMTARKAQRRLNNAAVPYNQLPTYDQATGHAD